MNQLLRLTALLGAAGLAACVGAAERNAWPVVVQQVDAAGQVESWEGAGPFLFSQNTNKTGRVSGFRPLFVTADNVDRGGREVTFLYPLFLYREWSDSYSWSVFELINRSGPRGKTTAVDDASGRRSLDIWPFWFSRNTGSPESSYRALFPIAGTARRFWGYDRVSWTLFPLYSQASRHGYTTTAVPWPFIRITKGSEQGFAFWPLFGWRDKPEAFHDRYVLWPFFYHNVRQAPPDAPTGTAPTRNLGVLPFYASTDGPGIEDRSYVWPFFGYTHRSQPIRYDEARYFWPFFVQGNGPNRRINRWAPFYTHSVIKGTDKTWVLWPAYREARWDEDGVAQTKTQLLYFLYWSLEQRSLKNPNAAPAVKTHLWPILSEWDNGAGRKQAQFPSPLEVFFPNNVHVRRSWTPLFALYRFDQLRPDDVRHEFLWGAVTWHRQPEKREFHLGPLFSVDSAADRKRIALGNGLLGLRRTPDHGWRLFWFDFKSDSPQPLTSSR
jgi:hypothetical protein